MPYFENYLDMTKKTFFKRRIYFTGFITLGIWSLLLWDHFHGGVPSHHLMQQENLPAISNWWGGLVLPFLTFYLTYRIQIRLYRENKSIPVKLPLNYLYRFLLAISFGVILSMFFTHGYSELSGYMVYGLIVLALFFPIYRAECLLGFVIGMTYSIGAVLPTVVGIIMVLIGAVLYLYVGPGVKYIVRTLIST